MIELDMSLLFKSKISFQLLMYLDMMLYYIVKYMEVIVVKSLSE